jgi:hypothetical protein
MIQSSLLHTGTSTITQIEEYLTENDLLIQYLSKFDQQNKYNNIYSPIFNNQKQYDFYKTQQNSYVSSVLYY